jgi:hypothetical protein
MAIEEVSIATETFEQEGVVDIEKNGEKTRAEKETRRPELYHVKSHASNHHDMANVASPTGTGDRYAEHGDDIYNKFSHRRKMVMVAVVSFCGFLAPISSTAVLAAVPEVAAEFNTTGSVINVTNALYLVFMGLSPVFWGPIGQVYGRRIVC